MGIVFVLCSGIPWEMLPEEMGCSISFCSTGWRVMDSSTGCPVS